MSKSPTVAIVIPTYNRDELLEACLEHLQNQTFRSFRVIIVDNGSRDSMPPALSKMLSRFDSAEWIPLLRNCGTATAFNRGLAGSAGFDYLFLLNNDAELEPECLSDLVRTLESDAEYDIAIPKLVQWSDPKVLDGVGDEMLLGGGAYRVGHGDPDAGQYDQPQPALSACAAAALYRCSLFKDVGNFDEDFFAYCEDTDLGLRAQLRGHRCIYVPNARVRHRGSATTGATFHPKIMRLTTRNRVFVILKNYPASVLLRLTPQLIVFQALWLIFALRKRAFLASCLGFGEVILLLPKMLAKRAAIQSKRSIGSDRVMAILRESEMRIWRWHTSANSPGAGKLLTVYFGLFRVSARGDATSQQ